jgi:hypothetical protein
MPIKGITDIFGLTPTFKILVQKLILNVIKSEISMIEIEKNIIIIHFYLETSPLSIELKPSFCKTKLTDMTCEVRGYAEKHKVMLFLNDDNENDFNILVELYKWAYYKLNQEEGMAKSIKEFLNNKFTRDTKIATKERSYI